VKQLDSVEWNEMNQFEWIFLNECISSVGHHFYTLQTEVHARRESDA
jgi:hypothetical protein